ncbi:hypothetical protein Tco_1378522 [Tanacetum coccineum]
MMTYLKNMGGYKHSQLKAKSFEEIKGMYERQKKSVQDFMPIGSERDKKMIYKMNKKADGMDEEEMPEEPVSTKVEVEQESTKKRKLGIRKKMKSRKRSFRQGTSKGDKTDNDIEKENDELRLCLIIASDEDKEVNYEMLDKNYQDLCVVYQLVMNKYQDETPEGFDRILWGDLMIMFNPTDEDEFSNLQQDWNVIPELKLEFEEDSTMALELIRFVKKLIAELEPENSNGDGKDL